MNILNKVLLFSVFIMSIACMQTKKISNSTSYSKIKLSEFRLNGISLYESYKDLILVWGEPHKVSVFPLSEKDTVETLYYLLGDSEIVFTKSKEEYIFSHAFFEDNELTLNSNLTKFSLKTKLMDLERMFPESAENIVRIEDKQIFFVRFYECDSCWLRFEFYDKKLKGILFDSKS